MSRSSSFLSVKYNGFQRNRSLFERPSHTSPIQLQWQIHVHDLISLLRTALKVDLSELPENPGPCSWSSHLHPALVLLSLPIHYRVTWLPLLNNSMRLHFWSRSGQDQFPQICLCTLQPCSKWKLLMTQRKRLEWKGGAGKEGTGRSHL